MDPRSRGFSGSLNGIQLGNQYVTVFPEGKLISGPTFEKKIPDQKSVGRTRFGKTFLEHKFGGIQFIPTDPLLGNIVPSSSVNAEEEIQEDCDLSDEVLRYISRMLMEEDMEDKTCMLQESLDLQAAEKSFYEVLGKKYPPSPEQDHPTFVDRCRESTYVCFSGNHNNCTSSSSNSNGKLSDPTWINNLAADNPSKVRNLPAYNGPHSSVTSSNSGNCVIDGFLDSPISPLQVCDLYNESQSIWQFRKGVEEASKFLPSGNELFFNFEVNGLLLTQEPNRETIKVEKKDEGQISPTRGRKNPHREDVESEEERCSKQAAVYPESTVRSAEFDLALLCARLKDGVSLSSHSETVQNGMNKNMEQKGQSEGYRGRKVRGKRQNRKKEVIDLRTLLIHCAQAVAADDRKSANDLMKQIRKHSSPSGDGNQRLAHCFADGLEARLAGTGSQIHKALVSKRASAADYLKAYKLFLESCPFRKISNFAANRTIRISADNAPSVHIIDFGILYGFQWPTFIQYISRREGGPPKLRITGVELPQPGFRPAERIEETGHRLADYAKSYNVPFEYNAIAKKWETVKVEDLKIDNNEFLVVNCLYRSKNLLDETVVVDSPRKNFLNLIRKINPDIFIHGITNGAYNAPFFITRFREALFHFSAMFDMLETNVPREHCGRILVEREIFRKEALNVIACEGWERVEKPETYRQWHVRNLKAGFTQLPFERETMRKATERVRSRYHTDFVIDEDNHWLLQGWKGRIMYAISCWKPV